MGYESTLIIGIERGFSAKHNKKEYTFVDPVAVLDISCCYDLSGDADVFRKASDNDRYYTEVFGKRVFEDCYGEDMKISDVHTVFNWLNSEKNRDPGYRRFMMLNSLLKSYEENPDKWEELIVLHYGH